jgi:uncharacterized protein
MIFVDSGAWFAGIVTDDVDHEEASEWFELNTERLFVTDYIIDETLTLLRARGEYRKAVEMGNLFFGSDDIFLHFLTEQDIRQTWEIFKTFSDKEWSFTDCSSKLICQRFDITQAFSFDKHFKQFGTLSVLP